MSVAGSNCAEISVAPRNVRDRTRRMPGTSISACSIGRVTVSVIDCRRRRAGVRDDDDARELQRRIDAARQREARNRAGDDEERRQQQDGAGLPERDAGGIHCSTVTFAPSGSPLLARGR